MDGSFALRPEALEAAIEADKAAGILPACVVASIGATGVGAVDPLAAIGRICRKHGLFLHVDAAWAGSALILPEQRWMIEGIDYADSFVFNPHKWLFTNFDCSAHFVRDSEALIRTLSILPEYLRSRETGQVIDYRDWSVPLGRRFRALKLWFVIRSYGVAKLQEMLRNHIAWTETLAAQVAAAPDFELTTPPKLSLFTFRYKPAAVVDPLELDALNERLLHAVNDDGYLYLTQVRIPLGGGDRFVIRWSVGQTYTQERHLQEGWARLREIAATLAP